MKCNNTSLSLASALVRPPSASAASDLSLPDSASWAERADRCDSDCCVCKQKRSKFKLTCTILWQVVCGGRNFDTPLISGMYGLTDQAHILGDQSTGRRSTLSPIFCCDQFWEFPLPAWAVASCSSGPQAGGTPQPDCNRI